MLTLLIQFAVAREFSDDKIVTNFITVIAIYGCFMVRGGHHSCRMIDDMGTFS